MGIGMVLFLISITMIFVIAIDVNKTVVCAESIYTDVPVITVLTHGIGGKHLLKKSVLCALFFHKKTAP